MPDVESKKSAVRPTAWPLEEGNFPQLLNVLLINEEGGGTERGNQEAVRPDREYIRRVFNA